VWEILPISQDGGKWRAHSDTVRFLAFADSWVDCGLFLRAVMPVGAIWMRWGVWLINWHREVLFRVRPAVQNICLLMMVIRHRVLLALDTG